jgi:hypothetical protein
MKRSPSPRADPYSVSQHAHEKSLPVTNIRTSTYYSNVLKFQQLKPNPKTGGYFLVMQLPDDSQLTYFDVDRLGDWVLAVLNDPAKYIGVYMYLVSVSRRSPHPH